MAHTAAHASCDRYMLACHPRVHASDDSANRSCHLSSRELLVSHLDGQLAEAVVPVCAAWASP